MTEPPGPPHDDHAEQAVLGAMLLDPRAALEVSETLDGTDFWAPRHETIYDTIRTRALTGQGIDAVLIADALGTNLGRVGGLSYLLELAGSVVTTANAGWYADIILGHAHTRRALKAADQLRADILNPGDRTLDQLLTAGATSLAAVPTTYDSDLPGETIDHLLAGDDTDDDYDWLIEGFLERKDRLILTAGEGAGKSTLVRQWAVQAAAGIHPTTGHPCAPIRVLLIDLENSRKQTRRNIRALAVQAGNRLDPNRLVIHCKTDGLDLTSPTDRAWLDQMVAHHQPDLLITGPIYKMANGNPNDEVDAKPVALALDAIRAKHDVAIVLEAHSRKGEGGKHRPIEPFGWSGWMRWPEFGIHLGDEGQITHWRGKRDDTRLFPHQLNRGGEWPWSPLVSLADQRYDQIKQAIINYGKRMPIREIETATGISKSAVQRLLQEHHYEIEKLVYDLELETGEAPMNDITNISLGLLTQLSHREVGHSLTCTNTTCPSSLHETTGTRGQTRRSEHVSHVPPLRGGPAVGRPPHRVGPQTPGQTPKKENRNGRRKHQRSTHPNSRRTRNNPRPPRGQHPPAAVHRLSSC